MSVKFQVAYTAQLARLNLDPSEVSRFQSQLDDVLKYVEKLEKVNVDSIEPMAHPRSVMNVFREDIPGAEFAPSEALRNAPKPVQNLFIVPKVIES